MTHGKNDSATAHVPIRWKSMFSNIDRLPRRTKILMLPEMLRAFADVVQKHSSDAAAGYMRLAADEIEEQRENKNDDATSG